VEVVMEYSKNFPFTYTSARKSSFIVKKEKEKKEDMSDKGFPSVVDQSQRPQSYLLSPV
jgi:hypothetical protein